MKRKRKDKHQRLVDIIYQELQNKKYVAHVFKNFDYPYGEFDVLYITEKERVRYIEVKSNDTQKSRKTARRQFKTYQKKFYLGSRVKFRRGIYYTPQTSFRRDLDVYKPNRS